MRRTGPHIKRCEFPMSEAEADISLGFAADPAFQTSAYRSCQCLCHLSEPSCTNGCLLEDQAPLEVMFNFLSVLDTVNLNCR